MAVIGYLHDSGTKESSGYAMTTTTIPTPADIPSHPQRRTEQGTAPATYSTPTVKYYMSANSPWS